MVYAVTTPLHSLFEMDRQSQPNRRGCHCWSCRINHLLFAEDLVLLTSSEQGLQHAHDRFSVAYIHAGMKTSTEKTEVLYLSRNLSQCMLQVSGNTLQQVEEFK